MAHNNAQMKSSEYIRGEIMKNVSIYCTKICILNNLGKHEHIIRACGCKGVENGYF